MADQRLPLPSVPSHGDGPRRPEKVECLRRTRLISGPLHIKGTTTMLELRPTCEHCNTALPPHSREARICTYECTFCATCVEHVLGNVYSNCGGGFVSKLRKGVGSLFLMSRDLQSRVEADEACDSCSVTGSCGYQTKDSRPLVFSVPPSAIGYTPSTLCFTSSHDKAMDQSALKMEESIGVRSCIRHFAVHGGPALSSLFS